MGIKFYSASDGSSHFNLAQAEKLRTTGHVLGDTINDILEKYNITKLLAPDISWTPDYVELRQWASPFMSEVLRWFNTQVTDDTILTILQVVDHNYIDDFWALFEKQKLYKRISASKIETHLFECSPVLHVILRQKQTCTHYDDVITAYIESKFPVDLLISAYDNPSEYTLPRSLTSEKIEQIFSAYVASENTNPNTLQRISQWKSVKPFVISDSTKYAAKQKHDKYSEAYFQENTGIPISINIEFSDEQNEFVLYEQTALESSISYSSRWITDNLDYPTLLNNLIYMLEFVDPRQMRVSAVSKKSERGLLELGRTDSNKYMYDANLTFRYKQMLVAVQFQAYYEHLKRKGIALEDVIAWFFNTYIPQEFNGPCISIQLSSAESSYRVKCSGIKDIYDSISKQYHHYVRDGAINLQFLAFSNSAVPLSQTHSQTQGKYIYGSGLWIENISFVLFSNQSILKYSKKHESSHDSFIELISNETVILSDYEPYQLQQLEWLKEEEIIETNEIGEISISNISLVTVLYDLYHNEVISYYRYPSSYQEAFEKLKDRNAIVFSSTLLTKAETEYFSYYLDDQQFSNGLKLRNQYSHGASHIISDENIHYDNYLTFLRLLALLIIKINDDFCITDTLKHSSQSGI